MMRCAACVGHALTLLKNAASHHQPPPTPIRGLTCPATAVAAIAPVIVIPPGGGASRECLVTLVVKVDLGGWLGDGSLLWRLGRPVADAVTQAWLEPLLMSVVLLRDKVEQSRFVVRPYSMGEEDRRAVEDGGGSQLLEAPKSARLMER